MFLTSSLIQPDYQPYEPGECQCEECPTCCPTQFEEYSQAWDAFYAAAEARIEAGETAEEVLNDEDNSVDAFMDENYDRAFHGEYQADAMRRFPLVADYWKARQRRDAERYASYHVA